MKIFLLSVYKTWVDQFKDANEMEWQTSIMTVWGQSWVGDIATKSALPPSTAIYVFY